MTLEAPSLPSVAWQLMTNLLCVVTGMVCCRYAGDAEMYDCDTKERLLPGPVVVCGPPGTEPVSGQWKSQTRFDDKESLVYSRVSQDMSISRGFIHKSGCLQYIPPKDTPPVTAEVFAKPWSQKKR